MSVKKRIAVLVEREYEDLELWYPYLRLVEAGYDVAIVGPEANKEYPSKHGYMIESCIGMVEAKEQDWDGVVTRRMGTRPAQDYPEMVELVRKTDERNGCGRIVMDPHYWSRRISCGARGNILCSRQRRFGPCRWKLSTRKWLLMVI